MIVAIRHGTGGLIGTLPTEQHGVSGQFYVVDSKTLFIDNFNQGRSQDL